MSNSLWRKRLLEIAGTEDLERLKTFRTAEQIRLSELLSSSPIVEVVNLLNQLHDVIIGRALSMAEKDVARRGLGAPPVPYAYLLFGSGGRFEQTMYSDQDSGLVYGNPEDDDTAERCRSYFNELAQTAVRHLIILGYPPCEGNIVASNVEWCLSLDDWHKRMDGWFAEPGWENVRYLLIAADARPVAGDFQLAARLQNHFYNDLLKHPVIASRMLENTLRHKVLVGFFGQLLRERYGSNAGSLDIKYGAYIPMVNAIRLLAVQAGIKETSTLKRIDALHQAGVLHAQEAEEAALAFSFVLKMRMLTTAVCENGQMIGTGKIAAAQLGKELIPPLKKALKTGRKIQLKVEKEMKIRFGGR